MPEITMRTVAALEAYSEEQRRFVKVQSVTLDLATGKVLINGVEWPQFSGLKAELVAALAQKAIVDLAAYQDLV